MDAERWERVQSIFSQAADLSGAGKRRFVEEQCSGDAELAGSVFALLAEDESGHPLLDGDLEAKVAAAAGQALRSDHLRSLVEQQIGPYKLLRVLGEGGMGIVYLAERTDIGGLVAIKLLRDAWLSPMRRERFVLEQQTLVKLNHPAIARLYDASTMEDGTPWFVMEYADGLPLTEYVRTRAAGLQEDLLLFENVCEAVQYAHAHAVIHRDLKPSNVLVTKEGGVKLLDFGIAKQLAPAEGGGERTITGLRLLTPGYAAPEQYSGGDVGVYTDVYSLGVLLYEMLTGQLPDPEKARVGQLPARPSASVKSDRTKHSLALSRREWADLDVLSLKALEPEPGRRYASVDAMIRDVSAHRDGRVLEARPNSLAYTADKFIRRNWLVVGSIAAGLILLIAGTVLFTVRLERARNAAVAEARRTTRIQQFLLEMLGNADPEGGPSSDLKVVTLLNRALTKASSLGSDPETQVQLYLTIGSMYRRLGKYEQSEHVLAQALDRATQVEGAHGKHVAALLVPLAAVRGDRGELEQAQRTIDQAAAVNLANRLRPDDSTVVQTSLALGRIELLKGEYQKAIDILLPIAHPREAVGDATYELRDSASALGEAYIYIQRYDLAERYGNMAVTLDRRLFGESHPRTAEDISNLASIEATQGHFPGAEALYRESIGIMTAYYGADNPDVLTVSSFLARMLSGEGKLAEAEPLLQTVLEKQEKVYGLLHERVAFTLESLGRLASQRKEGSKAETYQRRALEIYASLYPGINVRKSLARANLGNVYLKEGKYRLAESTMRQTVQELATLPNALTFQALAYGRWGCALFALKQYDEAEQQLTKARSALKSMPHPPSQLREFEQALVELYLATHRPEQAKTLQAELAVPSH